MSDSIKKYFEMLEDGEITETSDKNSYTELELVDAVAKIARHYKNATPELIRALAIDEIKLKKVCD